MVTFFQLIKGIRQYRKKQCLTKALRSAPQRKGTCSRVFITAPKKPCSAKRKVAVVEFKKENLVVYSVLAYIPGIGHHLVKSSPVLVRGGGRPDLPGIHYIVVRGKHHAQGLLLRRKARSKYGVKYKVGDDFKDEWLLKKDRFSRFKGRKK